MTAIQTVLRCVLVALALPGSALTQAAPVQFEPLAEATNLPGLDYRNFELPAAEAALCQAECAQDERCKAFTYVEPGLQGQQARCWLKQGVPAAAAQQGRISGVKFDPVVQARLEQARALPAELFEPLEQDSNRPGLDYRSLDLARPEPLLCQLECAAEARCKAFTYVKPGIQAPGARCWLKHSVPASGADGCCVSGVKRAGAPIVTVPEAPPAAPVAGEPEATAQPQPPPAAAQQEPVPAAQETQQVLMSYAQRIHIDEYGWPETFTLLMYAVEGAEAPVRQETWNYHTQRLSVTFIDGRLVERGKPLAAIDGALYPVYRPTQFQAGMGFEDVLNAVPAIEEFAQEQMPDETMSTYWAKQLVMGFIDDVLVYVETRPQLPGTAHTGETP